MPFLRFSRDKRGYENTYLCHTFRRGGGPPRLRVLYWFRTPPGVKVGRAALTPEAIRAIEESNPELRFDWDTILKVKPPPAPVLERLRRDRSRVTRGQRRAVGGKEAQSAGGSLGEASERGSVPNEPEVVGVVEGKEGGEAATGEDAWEADVPASQDGTIEGAKHVVLGLTDAEGLARLRARHSEILTRIDDRVRDPEKIEQLREQAALLNPDAWATVEEARERIASLDEVTAALRKLLGRRRRKRRGRGRKVESARGKSEEVSVDGGSDDSEPSTTAPAVSVGEGEVSSGGSLQTQVSTGRVDGSDGGRVGDSDPE